MKGRNTVNEATLLGQKYDPQPYTTVPSQRTLGLYQVRQAKQQTIHVQAHSAQSRVVQHHTR